MNGFTRLLHVSRAVVVVAVAALATGACFRLDPFLYSRPRVDAYDFEVDSDDPKEVITSDRFDETRISVTDTIEVAGVYVRANVQPPRGHVIYFHGQGGSLDRSFGKIKRIANLGFDTFAINYRGFGTSTNVAPTEAGIAEDTKAALAYLRDRVGSGVPIGYYGQSLGTAVATQLALSEPPAAMVLESPFASVEALKTDSSQMDFPIGFIADANWDTEHRIGRVFAPLLIMHGTEDDYVRPEFSERIFANANQPKRLVLVPGADHGDVAETAGDDWDEAVRQHFITGMAQIR